MKYLKRFLAVVLAGVLAFSLTGCLSSNEEDSVSSSASESETPSSESEAPSEGSAEESTGPFDASPYCDDFGHYKDVDALALVTLPELDGIEVPYEEYTPTESDIQAQIDQILSSHSQQRHITEGTVEDGDTVNIDYVGSQNGVEFAGGSTGGNGTDVTIGVTSYIDGFLDQLIGHKPGENFDINVTFPDPYPNNPDLAGKPAVFNITINYIVEEEPAELTDAFVEENFGESMGWHNIAEMKDGIRSVLGQDMLAGYLSDYLVNNSTVSEEPQMATDYWNAYLEWYVKYMCTQHGITMEEYLAQSGVANMKELIVKQKENISKQINYDLVMQAAAQKLEYEPAEEEIEAYMDEYYGTGYYAFYKESVPRSTMLKPVINELTLRHLSENVTLMPQASDAQSQAD